MSPHPTRRRSSQNHRFPAASELKIHGSPVRSLFSRQLRLPVLPAILIAATATFPAVPSHVAISLVVRSIQASAETPSVLNAIAKVTQPSKDADAVSLEPTNALPRQRRCYASASLSLTRSLLLQK
ncbi:hypothetical protein M0R45_026162 [Rubus argutus]|uniref:Uncharacterized protein n=1 Tax=Rubus argutus TaxID=59490 RepID=A0AAW1WXD8_RUBAR